MERRTRVRFAPSPTGPLHMGGVRTALYNYLFAKQRGGDFILRIEDTDSNRFVPGAEEYIIEALNWCGIVPDEGVDVDGRVVETASERHPHAPYRQNQRRGIYRKYAEQLIANGYAYYAFDSSEDLEAARAAAEGRGETFTYNQKSRLSLCNSLTLSPEETQRRLKETTNWTIRFKMPENTVVAMDDMIRGHIEVNTDTLDDKVLWKRADELPTYHLANIVDDHLMEITEVIRGEEWLPSLPLHYMLYKAFGWEETRPRFAHLSLLLKPVGNGKLSKRDGDKMGFPVFPLRWVNAEGWKDRLAEEKTSSVELANSLMLSAKKITEAIIAEIGKPDYNIDAITKLSDNVVKIMASAERVANTVNRATVIDVFTSFDRWLLERSKTDKSITPEILATINRLHQEYINHINNRN